MKKKILPITLVILVTAIVSTITTITIFQYVYLPAIQAAQANPSAAQFTSNRANVSPTFSAPDNFISTAAIVTPSVVNITVYKGDYRVSAGSGVVISSDGYIVTNHHVIDGSSTYEVTLSNKKEYMAELVGVDINTDLALLKINARNLQTIRMGNSDRAQVGEWVLAVGNPYNLASTVTAGILSAKARSIQILSDRQYSVESFIQTDAVVNPGNSGGALVNVKGELIGINTAIMSESGGYEGFSFAIPSNLVRKIVTDLRTYGEVQRAMLGVIINDINSDLAQELHLKNVEGVLIQAITSGSTASNAGLKKGDVITHINDVKTSSTPELQEQIARLRPGDRISIAYIRNGREQYKANIRLSALAN